MVADVRIILLGDVDVASGLFRMPIAGRAFPRSALPCLSAVSMRPLVAHCHLGLGKLARRTDQREQARERFATATTMYREMGMTYWLEQAETEWALTARLAAAATGHEAPPLPQTASESAMMNRRAFLGTSAYLAAPLAAEAQPAGKVYRIGVLETTSPALNAANLDAFRQGLRELGYVEGHNCHDRVPNG